VRVRREVEVWSELDRSLRRVKSGRRVVAAVAIMQKPISVTVKMLNRMRGPWSGVSIGSPRLEMYRVRRIVVMMGLQMLLISDAWS
jgi:hypothetical protein